MNKVIKRIVSFSLALFLCLSMPYNLTLAHAEENLLEGTVLYVTASKLNGRLKPSLGAEITCYFMEGWEAITTGLMQGNWMQVYGSEYGTCWVSIDYLTEEMSEYLVQNTSGGRVKIRSTPSADGKVVGYITTEAYATVRQTLFGFGRIAKGWVNLDFFTIRR